MQVKWLVKAFLNLDNAMEYIAADNPAAAAEVALRIWDASQMLSDQPGMGRPGRVAGTRELVISGLPYILPYVEKGDVVFILRVYAYNPGEPECEEANKKKKWVDLNNFEGYGGWGSCY